MRRLEIIIILSIFAVGALIIYIFSNHGYYARTMEDYTYDIGVKWDLPSDLNEISGITYLGDSLMGAVQDENGIIYIYDLENLKISDTIDFAEEGDFEGIAMSKKDAYIMRSDGLLFEMSNHKDSLARSKKSYQTLFNAGHNVESLTLDEAHNRLLIIAKDRDPLNGKNKGAYAFSLSTKKMSKDPVFTINLEEESFKQLQEDKGQKRFRPSDIAIHPITKEFYIIEGAQPKLIILSAEGIFKKLYLLNPADFQQPEGITFGPDGTLYISNEKHATAANILEVILK